MKKKNNGNFFQSEYMDEAISKAKEKVNIPNIIKNEKSIDEIDFFQSEYMDEAISKAKEKVNIPEIF